MALNPNGDRKVVTTVLSKDLVARMQAVCAKLGQNQSAYLRRALAFQLASDEKALAELDKTTI